MVTAWLWLRECGNDALLCCCCCAKRRSARRWCGVRACTCICSSSASSRTSAASGLSPGSTCAAPSAHPPARAVPRGSQSDHDQVQVQAQLTPHRTSAVGCSMRTASVHARPKSKLSTSMPACLTSQPGRTCLHRTAPCRLGTPTCQRWLCRLAAEPPAPCRETSSGPGAQRLPLALALRAQVAAGFLARTCRCWC